MLDKAFSKWWLGRVRPFKDVPAGAGSASGAFNETAEAGVVLPMLLPVWLARRARVRSRRLRA